MESEIDTLKKWYDAQIDTLKKWYDTLAADDSLWYDALAVEDSLKVYNALAAEGALIVGLAPAEDSPKVKNPLEDDRKCELLKKLWNADAQARVELTLEGTSEGGKGRGKGRTALHVAARRGNVKLVKRILEMAENGTHGAPGEDQGTRSSPTDLNLLLSAKDSVYDLDALAMAVVNGNKEIVNLLTAASRRCKSNPYGISCNAEDDDSDLKEDQQNMDRSSGNAARQSGDKSPAPDQQSPAITLQLITKRIFDESDVTSRRKILKLYSEDYDFNFLDIWEYLFHFTFSTWSGNEDLILPLRCNLFNSLVEESVEPKRLSGQSSCQTSVWKYLLVTMRDGQGRTPLHVAVDSKKVEKFLDCIPAPEKGTSDKNEDHENYPDYVYLNARDSAGRTPLYRAAAKGNNIAVNKLLNDKRTDVSAKVTYSAHQWGADLDLDKLSWRNGFQCDDVYLGKKKLRSKGLTDIIQPCTEISSTVLHVAIIHKRVDIVKSLLSDDDPSVTSPSRAFTAGKRGSYPRSYQSDLFCKRRFTWPVVTDAEAGKFGKRSVNAMQLSVLVGNIAILQALLKEDVLKKKRNLFPPDSGEVHSLLLAAAMGSPHTIKAFFDYGQDPLVLTDEYGNTALHHALRGQYVKFQPHLVDFVGCEHVVFWRTENTEWVSRWLAGSEMTSHAGNDADKEEKSEIKKRYGQRRGCINLLLQAGMNIWKPNHDQIAACPESNAPQEFVTWWYDQVAEETKQAQEKLNAAANAISITAALVATASYLGPYTPPLGYSDSHSVQVNILAVRIFVVCNSLSFYAALVAIIYALLPSLPLPEESMFKELKKTRLLVAVSLAFLLTSIICVLLAFAASYIAVTPDHGLSHHSLAISTIVVGGFFCFLAITRFLERWINVLLTLPNDVTNKINFYEIFVNFDEIEFIFKNLKKISTSWIKKKIGRS